MSPYNLKTTSLLLLLSSWAVVFVAVQAQGNCSGATSCAACLTTADCGWWQGLCIDSCADVADTACFSPPDATTTTDSVDDVCAAATAEAQYAVQCAQKTNCDDCVATTLDGDRTCLWNDELPIGTQDGQCQSSCDVFGCGSATCTAEQQSPAVADSVLCATKTLCSECVTTTLLSDSTTTCRWYNQNGLGYCDSVECRQFGCGATECDANSCSSGASSCQECLNLGDSCAWAGGLCVESCSVIADTACYSFETFPGMSNTEICQAEISGRQDAELCAGKSSCSDCVGTVLGDGTNTCQWFSDETIGEEVGFCLHQCTALGCGSFECATDDTPTQQTPTEATPTEQTPTEQTPTEVTPTEDTPTEEPPVDEEPDESPPVESVCTTASGCQECLESACAWTLGGGGIESCNIGELAILSQCLTADSFPDLPIEAICLMDQQIPTQECSTATTCLDCVESSNNCAWTIGECHDDCDVADAACYRKQDSPDLTAEGICAIEETKIADWELCISQPDCTSCVRVTLTDGISNCMWFADASYCGSECGMDGCGASTCVDEPPPTVPAGSCASATACVDCLASESNCAWTIGECHDDCDVADAACYRAENFPNLTAESICEIEETKIADRELCNSQANCGDCVNTTLADGTSNCMWFENGGYCGSECGMNGCGLSTCSPRLCSNTSLTCEECLGLGVGCAWASKAGCTDSCDTTDEEICVSGSPAVASQLCAASMFEEAPQASSTSEPPTDEEPNGDPPAEETEETPLEDGVDENGSGTGETAVIGNTSGSMKQLGLVATFIGVFVAAFE